MSEPTIICRCEDLTLEDIRSAIASGLRTVDEIKRLTRCGMGPCQGRTCRQLVAAELSRALGIPLEQLMMPVVRPPLKPVSLELFLPENAAAEEVLESGPDMVAELEPPRRLRSRAGSAMPDRSRISGALAGTNGGGRGDLPATADAVVIGGGVHGCSVAYHLARAGMRHVVVLEKDYLAAGGTGRSAAGIRHQFGTEVNIRLSAASVKMMERLTEELEYPHSIDLLQKGYLMLAYNPAELELFSSNVALQKQIHADNETEILCPEEIRALNPHLNLEGVVGGSFNPRDGHTNPWHVTQAYADAAVRLGAEMHTFTPATGITLRGDRVVGVRTTRGEISAPVVVNCAGPWGAVVGAWVGVDVPLVPERHQILVTEPVEEIVPMMVISYTHGTYFKQTPHGSILMGYGDPQGELKALNQDSTWQFMEVVARKMVFHLPALAKANVVRQWAGLYDMTPDCQAILGVAEGLGGYYMDIGWSGHGFQLGPIVGRVLAQIITGEDPDIDVHSFRYGRFAEGDLVPEPACV